MTYNQIAYWTLQENKRANRAREEEAKRSNQAQEAEAIRSNQAREWETNRSNLAKESETRRANRAYERETNRHNQVAEALGWAQHEENARANFARERENYRSNAANEQIRREANVIQQQNNAWDYHVGLLNNEFNYKKLNYQYTLDEFNNSWRLLDKMLDVGGELKPLAAVVINTMALDRFPRQARWDDVWNPMKLKNTFQPSLEALRPKLPIDKDELLRVKTGPNKHPSSRPKAANNFIISTY